ncbi:MAG: hypothetical protein ACD_79C00240G0001, partial [uncultured bacterium]
MDVNAPDFADSLKQLTTDFKDVQKGISEFQMINEGLIMAADILLTAGITSVVQAVKYSAVGFKTLTSAAEKEVLSESVETLLKGSVKNIGDDVVETITKGIKSGEYASLEKGINIIAEGRQAIRMGEKAAEVVLTGTKSIEKSILNEVRKDVFTQANMLMGEKISTKLMERIGVESTKDLGIIQKKMLSFTEGMVNFAGYRGSVASTLFGEKAMMEQIYQSGKGLLLLGGFTSFAFTPLVAGVKTVVDQTFNTEWTGNFVDALSYNISKAYSDGFEQYNSIGKIVNSIASSFHTGMTFAYITPILHWNPNTLQSG